MDALFNQRASRGPIPQFWTPFSRCGILDILQQHVQEHIDFAVHANPVHELRERKVLTRSQPSMNPISFGPLLRKSTALPAGNLVRYNEGQKQCGVPHDIQAQFGANEEDHEGVRSRAATGATRNRPIRFEEASAFDLNLDIDTDDYFLASDDETSTADDSLENILDRGADSEPESGEEIVAEESVTGDGQLAEMAERWCSATVEIKGLELDVCKKNHFASFTSVDTKSGPAAIYHNVCGNGELAPSMIDVRDRHLTRECNDAFCGPQHVPHRLIANNNDAPAQDHALAESSGEKAPGDLAENSKVQHTVTLATYGAASTSSSDKAVQSIPSPR
ncbi:hypothetical protein PC121_g7435 [Phytophthora cactorum]|nr:hypothetical protein PC121_g7435 [Phytophthora cactorum]